MDHINSAHGGHQLTHCNGHGIHFNWKMRIFSIRSLTIMMPLEGTQQEIPSGVDPWQERRSSPSFLEPASQQQDKH